MRRRPPPQVHFFVTAGMHTYTEVPWFYSADGTGIGGSRSGGVALRDWASRLVLDGFGSTECDGDLVAQANWTGVAYCSSEMAGKTFTGPTATMARESR